MARHETEAVVLKVFDHGESDKIITLFTSDSGKITAIAKGAKRSKKRFVGKLELFNHLDIGYADNKFSSLVRIDEAELLNPFPALRSDYSRFVCATLASELVLNWTAEGDQDDNLFQLLTWTLTLLSSNDPLPTLLLFQLHLLSLLGFHLNLSSCCQCGEVVTPARSYRFFPPQNGVICSRCAVATTPEQNHLPLSLGTIKLLEKGRQLSMDKWSRLHFSKQSLQESVSFFQSHHAFLLQRDILSWKELHHL